MNSQEYDQIEEAADRLQHEASVKCSRELEKAQKYKEGYTQGVIMDTTMDLSEVYMMRCIRSRCHTHRRINRTK